MDPRFFLPCFDGPGASRLGHKRKENSRSITCRMDRAANIKGVFTNHATNFFVSKLAVTGNELCTSKLLSFIVPFCCIAEFYKI